MARSYKHIFLDHSGQSQLFKKKPLPIIKKIPLRNPIEHGAKIRSQMEKAWRMAQKISDDRSAVSSPTRDGMYLEFASAPDYELVTKSLEDIKAGIRLLTVREIHGGGDDDKKTITLATVYLPSGTEAKFLEKIRRYTEEQTDKGKPKNEKLVNSIEDIRLAVLESFWQDDLNLLPKEEAEWCEVWLWSEEDGSLESFHKATELLQVTVQKPMLRFPERVVLLIHANRLQLKELIESCDGIAEFRRAKETARFFLELNNKDQADWAQELKGRLSIPEDPNVAVTILDTGANNGHLLLEPLLEDQDCHAVDPTWGVHDHNGHGTLMCGLAGYGDLQSALESLNTIEIGHCLESAKIIPPQGKNPPELYGYVTLQGVSRTEIQAPFRRRITCMAVTTEDGRDRGRPSSWSAAIDQLTSGYADEQRRLFIVSAGNIDDPQEWKLYPESNLTNEIHDPGQSWNALTVGAFTTKARLTDPDLVEYEPIAPAGGLSPFSTTSLTWESNKWPLKPEIVLEGGNAAIMSNGFISEHDDLALLSTGHEPAKRQFDYINATSAACAQAAWMAA